MTQAQFGNAVPSPLYQRAGFIADIEILSSTAEGSYIQRGVTLAPGQGLLLAGTLLKRDATTKLYEKTSVPADAECILRQTVDTFTDTGATAVKFSQNALWSGILQLSKLKAANSGVTISSAILNARLDEARDMFIF